MQFSEDDRIILKALMKDAANEANEALHTKIDKMNTKVQNHDQTLYGPEGNNGLNGDVKYIKKKINEFDGYKKQAIAIAAGVGAVVSVGGTYLKQKLFGG